MPPHVKQVFEGDNGILAGLSTDKIWIDHSTTDYEQTQTFNDLAGNKGARCLEAPITGGLEALSKGQMTVFMAGEQQLAEEVSSTIIRYSKYLYTISPITVEAHDEGQFSKRFVHGAHGYGHDT